MDWIRVFATETPLLELIVRSTFLYFGILFLLRVLPRRTGGEIATMDLVFIVLIAEAAAHSLGNYESVGDGFVVIATLMGWNLAVNFLSYRVRFIERLISPDPLPVIRDGQLLRRNMRREFLTEEELLSRLHADGIEDIAEVKTAYIESEGQITVIKKQG